MEREWKRMKVEKDGRKNIWRKGRRISGGKGAENLRGESERANKGKEKDGKEKKVEEGKDIHNTHVMYICMLWGDTWFP